MTLIGSRFFSPFSIGIVGLVILFVLTFGIPALLMWVWNATMPELFGWTRLRYWQAFRLELISGLLFGIFRL
ncbi:hypothetical protein [Sulfobacillus thermosulfidooxidans]|uniref:hypothetical protein n=1 Tax=Sulfobacillus thermosulfidooxidans TaxID=28034 RepID=UPI0006B45E0B|nr:hypothetical protein [Sulfobacillus thermosulfidooxidans]